LPSRDSSAENQVILLPDSFNASYSAEVLLAAHDLLGKFGYKVLFAPVLGNGKALHVKGFRDEFKRQALSHVEATKRLAKTGLPLISVEVVTRLLHQKEYAEVLGQAPDYTIWSVESWIATQIGEARPDLKAHQPTSDLAKPGKEYLLLPHCMEQTADKQSAQDWQTIFSHLGLSLNIQSAGCCGMAGLFGHERENQKLCDDIFKLNWQDIASSHPGELLSSGYSCRCQLQHHKIPNQHPLTLLNKLL
jgi:Fe-S oxidoreductase